MRRAGAVTSCTLHRKVSPSKARVPNPIPFTVGENHPARRFRHMESCAAKSVESSYEEGQMEWFTAKSLKASVAVAVASASAAEAAAAEAAKYAALVSASAAEADTAKYAALASASAAEAAKYAALASAAAKHVSVTAVAAKHAEQATAVMEATATEQAEEVGSAAVDDEDDDDSIDSEAAYNSQMSGVEYLLAYKALPHYEIELILKAPVERIPFTDSVLFKNLCADPSATQYDIDEAAADYEEQMDMRVRFQEFVRKEYNAKGYVAVGEEYIARRIEAEAFTKKRWAELFAESDDDDSEEEEEQEAGEEIIAQ